MSKSAIQWWGEGLLQRGCDGRGEGGEYNRALMEFLLALLKFTLVLNILKICQYFVDLPITGLGSALLETATSFCCTFELRNDLREDLLLALSLVPSFVHAMPARGLMMCTTPKLGDKDESINSFTFPFEFCSPIGKLLSE